MFTLSSAPPFATTFLPRPLCRLLLAFLCALVFAAPVLAQSPVAWWKADGNALDSAGSSNGTLQGGVTYAPGVNGKAFSFNAPNAVVRLPDSDALKLTKSVSITAYVYAKSYPNPAGFIFFRGDSRGGLDPYNLLIYYHQCAFTVYDDHGGSVALISDVPFPLNRWVFITATLDDATGRMNLYFDGQPVGTLTTTIRPFRDLDPDADPGCSIGNYQNGNGAPFNGLIDDLKIYDTALSPSFAINTRDGAANAHALVTGYVTLRNPAPAGGETLPLSSDNAVATVPASVFVPEGASYATFPVQINSITSVNKANGPVSVTFGTNDGVEFSESSFTAYPAGIARADSFVQDGAGADANFGTAPSLLVSADGSGGSGNNRDTYLRFKFDGFHSVSKAVLRIYASVSDGVPTPVGVYGVATNGWDQATLTFNNRPALTTLVKTFTIANTGVPAIKYDINVTPYIAAALASGKTTVSFALHLPHAATGTVSVISKEFFGQKPQLILQGQ